jgi:hypothetical protein
VVSRQSKYLRRVALPASLRDYETVVLPLEAKAHGHQPLKAGIVRKSSRSARLTAKV